MQLGHVGAHKLLSHPRHAYVRVKPRWASVAAERIDVGKGNIIMSVDVSGYSTMVISAGLTCQEAHEEVDPAQDPVTSPTRPRVATTWKKHEQSITSCQLAACWTATRRWRRPETPPPSDSDEGEDGAEASCLCCANTKGVARKRLNASGDAAGAEPRVVLTYPAGGWNETCNSVLKTLKHGDGAGAYPPAQGVLAGRVGI